MNINDTPVLEQGAQPPMNQDPLVFDPNPLEFEEKADFAPPAVMYPNGEPTENEPVPSAESPRETAPSEQSLYWHQLLTGDADAVPDAVRLAAGAQEANLTPDERDYRIYSTVNRSWYADHRDSNRAKVQAAWPELRRGLATELKVADDEREIYMALSDRYDQEKFKTVAKSVYAHAYEAAVKGEPAPDLRDSVQNLPVEYAAAAHVVAVQAEEAGRYKREFYMPLAEELAEGMKVFMAIEEDLISMPQVLNSSPALMVAVNRFTKMSPEEQQLVMYLAVQHGRAQRAEAEEEGWSSRVARGFRRGVNSIGLGLWQCLAYTGNTTIDNLGEQLGSPALREFASNSDKYMQVLRRIRHATQQEVIPLVKPDSSIVEKCLMDAVESVPAALVATYAGGAGFLTLAASVAGDSVVESRLRAPETPLQMQFGAGVISGAVQSGIYVALSRVGGRLIERTINNFMKSCGKGVGKFSWAALKTAGVLSADGAKLMMAGKAAQTTDLGLHELASRLSGTASHIDWQQFGDNLVDVEVNMREAASLLPFLLIGSGRAALRHFREPHNLVGDGTRLLEWGIDEKKVNEIVNERNVDRKGELLQDALRRSAVWIDPKFVQQAVKALSLLNYDYFKGFESPEVVRDFLRLPAESSVVRRQTPPIRSHEEIMNTPQHAIARAGYTVVRDPQRLRNAMALWDEWWSRSHINEYSARRLPGKRKLRVRGESPRTERSSRYLEELQSTGVTIPKRLSSTALYAPYAESERRALLQDRVAELQDLSYQFLMNVNPLDSLIAKEYSVNRMRVEAEKTREMFLGNIGKTLVNAGLGMPREENLGALCEWLQGYYLAKKYRQNRNGSFMGWIREVPADYLKKMTEHAPLYMHPDYAQYPELLEAYRIFLGVRANTELLMDLLPLTEDFQTALSRGMSPAQAYELLAERELGYKKENLKKYPSEQVAQSLNVTPMKEYTALNEEKCNAFMQLTGNVLQQQQGDDGRTYWRLQRPNGLPSRWHESATFAMNDVAANAALTFLPLGKTMFEYWPETARNNNTNLLQLPQAKSYEFSGYDQLCNKALTELVSHWSSSAPYVQPGLAVQRVRLRFSDSYRKSLVNAPFYTKEGTDALPSYIFDAYSMATPIGLASARFYTAWQRLLASEVLSPQQAASFLNSAGDTWAQTVASLPPPEDADAHRAALADALTRFSEQYFLMKLPQLSLPDSVKEWVAMSAFCPPIDENLKKWPKQRDREGARALMWCNRMAAAELRELTPQVLSMRQAYGTEPLPDAHVQLLLDGMMGVDPVQNAEQAWCYRFAGPEALHAISPVFMRFLQEPSEWWARLAPQERRSLYDYILPFCEHNLPVDTPVGADPVEASIANLNSALQRFPQLHNMSFTGEKPGKILTLQLPQGYENPAFQFQKPKYAEPVFPYAKELREVGSYAETYLLPELSDPNVQYALQFLDALRKYPSQQPYVTLHGIYWKNSIYGGKNGLCPAGLELHKPMRPLLRVTRLLKEVHEQCAAKGEDSLTICGVSVPDVSPQALSSPALQNITVYRQMLHGYKNRSITDLCRLMPGDDTAPNYLTRNPYVVDVRHGIYMTQDVAVKENQAAHISMIPLLHYDAAPHRIYTEQHKREWGSSMFQDALTRLMELADADVSFMEHRLCRGLSLTEVLLRLFEDSNFSVGVLGSQRVHELAMPALRALSLSADIISCIAAPYSSAAPESVQAFSRLQKTVRSIRDDAARLEALEHVLRRGSPLLLEKAGSTTPSKRKNKKP